MSVLLFFVVLFVLILVHEWGHFIVAKKTGMRVDEFGIGFPPKLFGFKKGETEYTFNALPIGGFVKIWGENYGSDDESDQVDHSRAFGARPKWAQALVLIAGVAMNILFAWLLFVITYMVGVPTPVDESVAGNDAQLYVQSVLPDSPAASALTAGSEIIAVSAGDESLTTITPSSLTQFVTETAPNEVQVTYMDGDETNLAMITPVTGLDEENPDRALLGVSLVLVETQSAGLFESLYLATLRTYDSMVAIIVGLYTLIVDSLMGTADYSQIAGPVGIVNLVGDAAAFGLVALLTFTAFISLNLAIINLLPIPALDGGRLVFVAIEAATGKEIPPQWAGRLIVGGFALLMLLMVAVTFNDIVRLLS